MELLFILAVGFGLYYLFRQSKSEDQPEVLPTETQLENRNAEWAAFIARYHETAPTKSAKLLVERMLDDISAKGLPVPILDNRVSRYQAAEITSIQAAEYVSDEVTIDAQHSIELKSPEKPSTQVDNATLLLYFGAFLFVASVGLFVAFAGFSGVTRTIAVLLAVIGMYSAGIWLHNNKPKLEQAGVAFAGIGLASAPFVGLAAYSFVFEQTYGTFVWLMTSLACLGLYTHALIVLKKPLLNYVLLFTFLSLIQSGVSIIEAPVYYFGWALAAIGILYAVIGRTHYVDEIFAEASAQTAQLFLPIAVFASVLFTDSQGLLQLGVSVGLAACYYALEFVYAKTDGAREQYAIVSHSLALVSLVTSVYALSDNLITAGYTLSILAVVQTVLIAKIRRLTTLWYNFATVVLLSSIGSILVMMSSTIHFTVSIVLLIVTAAGLWLAQKRIDAFIAASIGWITLLIVLGQGVFEPSLTASMQAGLMAVAAFCQWLIVYFVRNGFDDEWRLTALAFYLIQAAGVIGATIVAGDNLVLVACFAIAMSIIALAERSRMAEWTSSAGIVIALPAIIWDGQSQWIFWNAIVALLANILIALKYRQETSRWLTSGLWLLLPLSITNGLQLNLEPAGLAWLYFIVGLCLVLSRAIARGVVFTAANIPLSSYARSASLSYVFGYGIALSVAIVLSLDGANSQLQTTLMLSLLSAVTVVLARYVEKRVDLMSAVPLLLQSVLLSGLRPTTESDTTLYLVMSTILAVVTYGLALSASLHEELRRNIQVGSILAATVTPLSYLFIGQSNIVMPVGLLVLSGLLYHFQRTISQSGREWIGGLALIAVWWIMYIIGVTNLQAYSHVLAGLFALYAIWRSQLRDRVVADQYILAALGTSTVPLVLQALSGRAGDIYGWWLLLEQVAFMLIGMSINKPLITKWGLYVALGSVLYQLRNLGWAALIVLALFIIGVAVYKLQTSDRAE